MQVKIVWHAILLGKNLHYTLEASWFEGSTGVSSEFINVWWAGVGEAVVGSLFLDGGFLAPRNASVALVNLRLSAAPTPPDINTPGMCTNLPAWTLEHLT